MNWFDAWQERRDSLDEVDSKHYLNNTIEDENDEEVCEEDSDE